jgi:hypothetical protein
MQNSHSYKNNVTPKSTLVRKLVCSASRPKPFCWGVLPFAERADASLTFPEPAQILRSPVVALCACTDEIEASLDSASPTPRYCPHALAVQCLRHCSLSKNSSAVAIPQWAAALDHIHASASAAPGAAVHDSSTAIVARTQPGELN